MTGIPGVPSSTHMPLWLLAKHHRVQTTCDQQTGEMRDSWTHIAASL
jgi:hypothetical protein